jgi:integrase
MRNHEGRQFKRAAGTLSEAKQLQASLRTEIAYHTPGTGSRMTFAQYAEEWCNTYAGRTSRGIRPLTLRDYRRSIHRDAIPFFGNMRLSEVQPRDIKRYAATWADKGMSNNTVRLRLSPLRALFATAFEDGLIRANPAAGLRNVYGRRLQDEVAAKALTDAQLDSLLRAARPEHRMLLSFLVETGLRVGEVVALRWQEVDLDAGRMRVVRRYYQGTIDTPKSRFGTRTIPLTTPMVAELRDKFEIIEPEPEDLVFTTGAGTLLDPTNVLHRFMKPAAVAAGIPWAHLHTLRHTCASRLFRAGWNAKQVQMVLGHHSPAFTLATYVHLIPDDLPAPVAVAAARE